MNREDWGGGRGRRAGKGREWGGREGGQEGGGPGGDDGNRERETGRWQREGGDGKGGKREEEQKGQEVDFTDEYNGMPG